MADGVTLLWHDVTERTRAEDELKRSGERLALAAEGANDGLWQWNLQTQEFYVSGALARDDRPAARTPASADPRNGSIASIPTTSPLSRRRSTRTSPGRPTVFQHEHRIRHEDGTYRRFLCRGVAVRGRARTADRIAGSLTDTTEQAIAQERLRSVGFLDPLTGLSNRAVFVEGLGRRLDEFKQRRGQQRFAVLYLDLDRFKIVNDSLGHLVGDELLVAVVAPSRVVPAAGRRAGAARRRRVRDPAERPERRRAGQRHRLPDPGCAERAVLDRRPRSVHLGEHRHRLRSARSTPTRTRSCATPTRRCITPSRAARRGTRCSTPTCTRACAIVSSLENDLRRAVASNDFEVHYQPIVSLTSGMCVGFESLVRWTRNGEPVSPATFIPIAEELGLIEPLGTWVLQEACRTFADWQRRFPHSRPRLHHRQRVEPAARAAELPARRRAGGAQTRARSRPTSASRSPRPR